MGGTDKLFFHLNPYDVNPLIRCEFLIHHFVGIRFESGNISTATVGFYQYSGLLNALTQREIPDNGSISKPSSDWQSQPSGWVNSNGALAVSSEMSLKPTFE
jgi:hypothetical protein